MTTTIAFDLDGTLFDHLSKPNYEHAGELRLSTRPIKDRCLVVKNLIEAGYEVHFITGRGILHAGHTLDSIRVHIHRRVTVNQLHMQAEFTGYPAMAQFKAQCLNEIGASRYIGDHAADREAAELAGVRYDHPDQFFAAVLA